MPKFTPGIVRELDEYARMMFKFSKREDFESLVNFADIDLEECDV